MRRTEMTTGPPPTGPLKAGGVEKMRDFLPKCSDISETKKLLVTAHLHRSCVETAGSAAAEHASRSVMSDEPLTYSPRWMVLAAQLEHLSSPCATT